MRDHVLDEVGDVIVVEVVEDPAAVPATNHEPQVAEDPQLVQLFR